MCPVYLILGLSTWAAKDQENRDSHWLSPGTGCQADQPDLRLEPRSPSGCVAVLRPLPLSELSVLCVTSAGDTAVTRAADSLLLNSQASLLRGWVRKTQCQP